MEHQERHENIVQIVAHHLAEFMRGDLPGHAEAAFKVLIAQHESQPALISKACDTYHDMVRPLKADEILNATQLFLLEPVFRARVQVITVNIEHMLDTNQGGC